MKIVIREPETKAEIQDYLYFRWRLLREPWQQPLGTETDKFESGSIQIMALDNNKIIGVGRAHFISETNAQIRYMAILPQYRGMRVGTKILATLEQKLEKLGTDKIILQARENAVKFYEYNNYKIYKSGELLFGKIKHFWMKKNIDK